MWQCDHCDQNDLQHIKIPFLHWIHNIYYFEFLFSVLLLSLDRTMFCFIFLLFFSLKIYEYHYRAVPTNDQMQLNSMTMSTKSSSSSSSSLLSLTLFTAYHSRAHSSELIAIHNAKKWRKQQQHQQRINKWTTKQIRKA